MVILLLTTNALCCCQPDFQKHRVEYKPVEDNVYESYLMRAKGTGIIKRISVRFCERQYRKQRAWLLRRILIRLRRGNPVLENNQ